MKKENIVDLVMYRKMHKFPTEPDAATISEELKTEIRRLIRRLREEGPLKPG